MTVAAQEIVRRRCHCTTVLGPTAADPTDRPIEGKVGADGTQEYAKFVPAKRLGRELFAASAAAAQIVRALRGESAAA
jgi:hypothetical protein